MEPCLECLLASGIDLTLFQLYIMHIDFWFFPPLFWLFMGNRVPLHSYQHFTSHNFFNVHMQINKCKWDKMIWHHCQARFPGSLKLGSSSGSHGTGEYPNMHWGSRCEPCGWDKHHRTFTCSHGLRSTHRSQESWKESKQPHGLLTRQRM